MSNADKSHKGLLLLPVFTLLPLLLILYLAKQIASLRPYGSKVDRILFECCSDRAYWVFMYPQGGGLYLGTVVDLLPLKSRRGGTTLQLPSLASSILRAR